MMIVDLRPINKEQPYNKINSVLDQLSKKWDQREGKSILEFSSHHCVYSYASIHRCDFKALQLQYYAQACFLRTSLEERWSADHGLDPKVHSSERRKEMIKL